MIEQHEGLPYQSCQQAHRARDTGPSELEISEASKLQRSKSSVISCKETIQSLCENVDDRSEIFPLPVELRHLLQDQPSVVEVRHNGWREEISKDNNVVKGNSHASARKRVSHIHRIAKDDEAWRFVR
jgi:hypothetical protein